MRFFRDLAGVLFVVIGLAVVPAWADQGGEGNNTGCNGQGNPNSPCIGGQGGAGGAGGNATSSATATAISTAVSVSDATASAKQKQFQGQGQDQYQGQSYEGQQSTNVNVKTDVPRQAPPAVPAGLSVSSLTCYGSWSIAASTPFGGVGAGFPTKDEDCERSRNAVIFAQVLNMPQVALALLSQNEANAKAMKAAGVAIPGQTAEAIPDLKLNTPLGEPKSEEPKSVPSNFGKRARLNIPAAMAATQAARLIAVQGQ